MRPFVKFQFGNRASGEPFVGYGYPWAPFPGPIDGAAGIVLDAEKAGHVVTAVTVHYEKDSSLTFTVLDTYQG